jgi:hypothetical protein
MLGARQTEGQLIPGINLPAASSHPWRVEEKWAPDDAVAMEAIGTRKRPPNHCV